MISVRNIFLNAANAFIKAGENDRAMEMLENCMQIMRRYPIESIPLGMNTNDYLMTCIADDFYKLGNSNRGREITAQLAADLLTDTFRQMMEFAAGVASDAKE